MKEIPLTKGYVALVDDEDFERASVYKWHALPRAGRKKGDQLYNVYVRRNLPGTAGDGKQQLHRFILGLDDPKVGVDHINGNGLDNRRSNLRICTASQNAANCRRASNNTSGYKGVHWSKSAKKWAAAIRVHKKTISLGTFATPKAASEAYARAAKKYFGEFANTGERHV